MLLKQCREMFRYAFLILSILFTSCKSIKDVSYFNELSEEIPTELFDSVYVNHSLKYKVNDVLAITVTALDPNSVAVFNNPLVSYMKPNSNDMQLSQQLLTYTIDETGSVNFPVLGKVRLEGLTRFEAIEHLQNKIKKYVQDPIVNIQLMNYRASVLGEVAHPGSYPIENERTTLLDVLAKAGDLTIYAQRENICLLREENGKRIVLSVNLYETDVLVNPKYYIQQNDIIYVRPNRAKSRNATYSQRDSFNISLFSAIVSTVSVLTSLLIALLIK